MWGLKSSPRADTIVAFTLCGRALLCDWTPMESFEGIGHDR